LSIVDCRLADLLIADLTAGRTEVVKRIYTVRYCVEPTVLGVLLVF